MVIKNKDGMEMTTLTITHEVRDWLDDKGERHETFDDILRRLLDIPYEETDEDKHEFAEDQLSGCLANKDRMGVKK